MTVLHHSGDAPWLFYQLAASSCSEQDINGLRLFHYCRKERNNPQALLTYVALLGNVYCFLCSWFELFPNESF